MNFVLEMGWLEHNLALPMNSKGHKGITKGLTLTGRASNPSRTAPKSAKDASRSGSFTSSISPFVRGVKFFFLFQHLTLAVIVYLVNNFYEKIQKQTPN